MNVSNRQNSHKTPKTKLNSNKWRQYIKLSNDTRGATVASAQSVTYKTTNKHIYKHLVSELASLGVNQSPPNFACWESISPNFLYPAVFNLTLSFGGSAPILPPQNWRGCSKYWGPQIFAYKSSHLLTDTHQCKHLRKMNVWWYDLHFMKTVHKCATGYAPTGCTSLAGWIQILGHLTANPHISHRTVHGFTPAGKTNPSISNQNTSFPAGKYHMWMWDLRMHALFKILRNLL